MKVAYNYHKGAAITTKKGVINGPPIITECVVLSDDGNIGLGRSICSPSDTPCKKDGHFWAKRRAIRALKGRKQCYVLRPEALQRLKEIGVNFTEKQILNPELTPSQKEAVGLA